MLAFTSAVISTIVLNLEAFVILNPLTLTVSLSSALIGSISHVLMDSVMHRDMQPFWPVSAENALQGTLSLSALHLFCVVCGIGGLITCGLIAKRKY